MFRFVGFTSKEAPESSNVSLLMDKVPEKKDLLGDYKISRFCSGYAFNSTMHDATITQSNANGGNL